MNTMSYFSYVGRFLSNVKVFYNEINSATLTGAIDAIVVQQEDGTYLCSPFHVRFGKLGVIRSREKIVDIEINGEIVDLQMKLGETGEAFFVQEGDGSCEIPAYLATSPIPSAEDLMERGVRELRKAAEMEDQDVTKDELRANTESTIMEEENPFPEKLELLAKASKNVTAEIAEEAIDTEMPLVERVGRKLSENKDRREKLAERQHSEQVGKKLPDMHKVLPKDSHVNESDNSSKESGTRDSTTVANLKSSATDKNLFSDKAKRRKKKKVSGRKAGVRVQGTKASGMDSAEQMFDMDFTSDEEELRLPPGLPSMVKSVSLPLGEEDRMGRTDSWASSQFEAHLYPFSETDLTPLGSPTGTRCSSPAYKSDTECDRQRLQETEAERLLSPQETVWDWGELPKAIPSPTQELPAGKGLLIDNTSTQPGTSDRDPPSSTAQSRGLFYFMRKTKSIRHKPEQEGIYLADLTKEEMDPEIAKLYFPKSSFHFMSIKDKEEDTESGRGASLPQSPHSVEGAIGGPPASYLMSEVRHLGEVSLSMCGGLAETEGHVSMESFMQNVVTFDSLCDNPGLTQHPDMVIRMGDKFFNWQTAAPQILSLVAFHKYLPESTVQNLMKEHMPKKEKKKGGMTSWFTWRRAPPDETQTATTVPTEAVTATASESVITAGTVTNIVETATTTITPDVSVTSAKTSLSAGEMPENRSSASVENPTAATKSSSEGAVPKSSLPLIQKTESSEQPIDLSAATTASLNVTAAPSVDTVAPSIDTASPSITTPCPAIEATAPSIEKAAATITSSDPTMQESVPSIETDAPSIQSAAPSIPMPTIPTDDTVTATPEAELQVMASVERESTVEQKTEMLEIMCEDPSTSLPSTAPSSPKKVLTDSKRLREDSTSENETDTSDKSQSRDVQSISSEPLDMPEKFYQKSLRLTSEQITKLNLKEGANEVTFSVTTQYQGTTRCTSHIYLWKSNDKIVISDIDGTITKSDVLGHILPILGRDWSQSGVAQLYTKINNNGYKFLYLSARAIGQSKVTKELLRNIRQDNLLLPDGPLMLSPISLISAFHREVIVKKPEEFKISCMSDIGQLFPQNQKPFYAGFGNKINDVYAYKALDIPFSRIFTINHRGELKHEKILTFQSSYQKLGDVVDHFFPPLQRVHGNASLQSEVVVPNEFRSVSYWRDPMPQITEDDLLKVKVTETKVTVKAKDSTGEKKK